MNPGNYLAVEGGLDSNGQLIVQIGNPTEVEIGGITLAISYVDGGRVRQIQRTLSETLAPGTSRRYATGLGPFTSGQEYDVRIESATPVGNR